MTAYLVPSCGGEKNFAGLNHIFFTKGFVFDLTQEHGPLLLAGWARLGREFIASQNRPRRQTARDLIKEAGIGSEGWQSSFFVALIGLEDQGGIFAGKT